jgi:hypothetical protein
MDNRGQTAYLEFRELLEFVDKPHLEVIAVQVVMEAAQGRQKEEKEDYLRAV